MLKALESLFNWFIPDSLKSEGEHNNYRKAKLFLRTIPILVILLTMASYEYTKLTGHVDTFHTLGISALLLIPFVLKFTGRYTLAASMLPMVALIALPAVVAREGGVLSVPMRWYLLLPLASIFFLGSRKGLFFSFIGLLEIGYLMLQHAHGMNAQLPFKLEDSWTYFGASAAALTLFVTYLSWLYERTNEQVEENLRRSKEKAVNAVKAKDIFWANISHEIRTPMNGILGMTNLLLGSRLDKEQEELLEIIRDCGESLNIIINDVLDYSKIESGELKIEKFPFKLKKCVEAVFAIFQHMAGQKELKLTYIIDSDVPSGILSDEYRIRQILVNLLGNAIKFTDHGEVSLIIERTDRRDEIKFTIKDTGIGIPRDKHYRLFKPFSQVDDSTSRRYGGSGLGLTICKKLTEMLGGRIGFESQKGVGSQFWFTITAMPVKLKADHEGISRSEERRQSPYLSRKLPLKILVAEDNLVNQKLLLTLLSRFGYQADTAHNGEEVLTAMHNKKYDLILMDIQMPLMDGITTTKEIYKRFESQRPVIIAVTANVLEEDKDRCFEAGMDDFLAKPISTSGLQAILERYGKKVKDPKDINGTFDKISVINDAASLTEALPFIGKTPVKNFQKPFIYKEKRDVAEPIFHFIDPQAILDNFENDMEVIQLIIDQFNSGFSSSMANLEVAIENTDPHSVEQLAHTLKGSVSNFFSKSVTSKIIKLEKMGKIEELIGADELLEELKIELNQMLDELYAFCPPKDEQEHKKAA